MRTIDHFIAGGPGPAVLRFNDVFDPNQGVVQAHVNLGTVASAIAADPIIIISKEMIARP